MLVRRFICLLLSLSLFWGSAVDGSAYPAFAPVSKMASPFFESQAFASVMGWMARPLARFSNPKKPQISVKLWRFRAWLLTHNAKRHLRGWGASRQGWVGRSLNRLTWPLIGLPITFLAVVLYTWFGSQATVIDSIDLPAHMSQLGYTSDWLRNDILKSITVIKDSTIVAHSDPNIKLSLTNELPKFEIPGTYFSLPVISDFAQRLLGKGPLHVTVTVAEVSTTDNPSDPRPEQYSFKPSGVHFWVRIHVRRGGEDVHGSPYPGDFAAKSPQEFLPELTNTFLRIVHPDVLVARQITWWKDKEAAKLLEEMIKRNRSLKWTYYLGGELAMSDTSKDRDVNKAIEFYRKAIGQDKKFFEAYFALGKAYIKKRDFTLAIDSFRSAIAIDKTSEASVFNLGVAYDANHDYPNAIRSFQKAIAMDPKGAEAHTRLGYVLAEQGKSREALEHYNTALDIDPKNFDAYFYWGSLLVDQGNFRDAVPWFSEAKKINPKDVDNFTSLGYSLRRVGRNEEAVEAYQNAIRLGSKDKLVYNDLGNALDQLDRNEEALKAHQNAVRLDPKFAIAYFNMGLDFRRLGRGSEAVDAIQNAIRLGHKEAVAYRELGNAFQRLGKNKEAIEAYQNAIGQNAKDADVYNDLGIAFHRLGRDPEAINAYGNALRVDPNHAHAYSNLGNALSNLGRDEEAIAAYRKAIGINATDPDYHQNLGLILRKMGRSQDANEEFKKEKELRKAQGSKKQSGNNPGGVREERHLPFGTGGLLRQARHNTGVRSDVLTGWQTVPGRERACHPVNVKGFSAVSVAGPKKADAVFEGGGVKGIGLVGAASVVEDHGYQWGNLAGTSAGSIVAALLAAGYTAKELTGIVNALDYEKFKDTTLIGRIPLVGSLFNLLTQKGVYKGDYFLSWITELLKAKGVYTFGDLKIAGETNPRYTYKLSVITSDISNGRLLQLPIGAAWYQRDPDSIPVAEAVRMSMSIPFFFIPYRVQTNYMVDGGILSNFPVWIFDQAGIPAWPTFGFKFIEPHAGKPSDIHSTFSFAQAIFSTMMEAHDKMHVEADDWLRTIGIPTMGVRATEFDITSAERDALFQSGVKAATDFFSTWNWQAHVQRRQQPNPNYVTKVSRLKAQLVGPLLSILLWLMLPLILIHAWLHPAGLSQAFLFPFLVTPSFNRFRPISA